MPMTVADRVKETSTTVGTGTLDLLGAAAGFRTFVAGIGNANQTTYSVTDGTAWEVGIGTVTDAVTDTLSRTTVLASSNAGALVNFGAGTKTVFCTAPAGQLTINGVAHSSLPLSTELTDVDINLARTVQFATGALATQRAFRVRAPTYSFVAASTITTASTLAISGPPIAGANATLTKTYALHVESGIAFFAGQVTTPAIHATNGTRVLFIDNAFIQADPLVYFQAGISKSGGDLQILPEATRTVLITPGSAASVPVTIRGAASQTANLTVWQNSASAIILSVGSGGIVTLTSPITLKGYTVGTLPTGVQGHKAFVTDALGPTYLVTVVGGGAVITEVFYNGTNWVCT